MTQVSPLQQAQVRLARHYLDRLHKASQAVTSRSESGARWLRQIDQDWGQIKQWQSWTAARGDSDVEKARICLAYCLSSMDLTRIRQNPLERLTWLKEALAAARTLDDMEAEQTILYFLGQQHFVLGAVEEAEAYASRLLELAEQRENEFGIGRAYYTLGSCAIHRSRFDEAERYLNLSLERFTPLSAQREIGRVLQGLGRAAGFTGRPRLALDYYKRYLTIVEGFGYVPELGVALLTVSNGLVSLFEFASARDYALHAVQVCRSTGYTRMLPAALVSLGDCELELGNFDAAVSAFQQGNDIARTISARSTYLHGLYGLGRVAMRKKDYAQAFELFEDSLAMSRSLRMLFYEFEIALDIAAAHLDHGSPARDAFRQALDVGLELDEDAYKARLVSLAARIVLSQGDRTQAGRWAAALPPHAEHLDPGELEDLSGRLDAASGGARRPMTEDAAPSLDEAIQEVEVFFG